MPSTNCEGLAGVGIQDSWQDALRTNGSPQGNKGLTIYGVFGDGSRGEEQLDGEQLFGMCEVGREFTVSCI